MSSSSSRGPEKIVVAADPDVTFWLMLENGEGVTATLESR